MPLSLTNQRTVQLGPVTYVYTMRRSQRAKRLLLKVNLQHGIEVVLPRWATYHDAARFVQMHQDWLVNILRKQAVTVVQPSRPLVTGQALPCLGEAYQLQINYSSPANRPSVKRTHHQLILRVPPAYPIRRVLTGWYRRQARAYFTYTSRHLASSAGVAFRSIIIGNQKTRWGSCSSRGRLAFNWRLLLGPVAVARYVAAHEVAHVRYRHHGAAFWRMVAQLDPDYLDHKAWLKSHGHTLVL